MSKTGFVPRALVAVAFVVLVVSGAVLWTVGASLVPWWVPFALAVGLPVTVGIALLIIDPNIFKD